MLLILGVQDADYGCFVGYRNRFEAGIVIISLVRIPLAHLHVNDPYIYTSQLIITLSVMTPITVSVSLVACCCSAVTIG
jgi:hypothetical protein